ncbi:hypothetical protein WA158_000284 [Blastocystis sp. Blastoise]
MVKGQKATTTSKTKQNAKKTRPVLTAFMIFAGENRSKIWEKNASASYVSLGKAIVEEWEKLLPEEKRTTDIDKKTVTKRKRKRDPNAPKAASAPYMFFFKAMRPKIKQENTEASFGEIGKKIGAAWRTLSEEQKEPYEKMAQDDRQRYQNEVNKYKEIKGEDYIPPQDTVDMNPDHDPTLREEELRANSISTNSQTIPIEEDIQ